MLKSKPRGGLFAEMEKRRMGSLQWESEIKGSGVTVRKEKGGK